MKDFFVIVFKVERKIQKEERKKGILEESEC